MRGWAHWDTCAQNVNVRMELENPEGRRGSSYCCPVGVCFLRGTKSPEADLLPENKNYSLNFVFVAAMNLNRLKLYVTPL